MLRHPWQETTWCSWVSDWAVGVCLPLPSIGHPAPFFLLFTPRQTMAFFTRPQSASAAVKIVAPSRVSGDPSKTSPKKGKAVP